MRSIIDGLLESEVGTKFSKEHREEMDKTSKQLKQQTEHMLLNFAAKSSGTIDKLVKLEHKKRSWREKHGIGTPYPEEYLERETEINELINEDLHATTMALNMIHLTVIVKALDIIKELAEKDEKPVQ